MRYTLKNYQEDAVEDVLEKLRRAKDMWLQYRDISSFSLSATTGAGKTVMAAAVIEALFYGSDNFRADPGAVVLWFTDDPSLNEQTRRRIKEASDLLDNSRLCVIEPSFTGRQLEHGNVYFLNRQKLAKKGLLVRATRGDRQAPTFWDVLRNTIEDDTVTLYVILDEAHRGMRDSNGANEKETIVKRLVNGQDGVPAVPIVWGISATVERFSRAMERAKGRTQLPNVEVDPQDVQESGLLKDNILLDFPTERGRFETVLLRRATRLIKDATQRWDDHLGKQQVAPLLVVQMPNTPEDRMLLMACRAIRDEWPDLDSDAMANVFGEHEELMIGSFSIPYVKPQDVQGRPHIRVLFAKDAVSTGWDCPRAEVLMSFRPASDKTHITQLLGRMVRTPLARRIEGDDLLNSVH
ncbi:MAG: DEAD/DEAH box helicase family protein [Bacteroidota bacterium]|nr:DEAD/DEAH box helicase family protein [Bacteroidota bacterium]